MMTMKVLQNNLQNREARAELKRRGLSALEIVGSEVKSWDVLSTAEFIENRVPSVGAILDLGAMCSEILVALCRLGYGNLSGVDLNPALRNSPHADVIRYEISDFMKTSFADSSFDAITAISVIEHGFNSQRLLHEIARLLRPGGFFIASFDYWPEKIDTAGQKIFDLDWLIFSEHEVRTFFEDARGHGLLPEGAMYFDAQEKTVAYGGYDYTFGWVVLQKSARNDC